MTSSATASQPASHAAAFYSDRVMRRINYRVDRLRRKYALNAEDAKDLRQDFLLALVQGERRYDPEKCPLRRFITMVLNRRYKHHVRRLAEIDDGEEGEVISLEELAPGHDEFLVDPPAQQRLRQVERRQDLAPVLAELSEADRELCQVLMVHTPYEAARVLGVAHTTVYRRMRRLRRVFVRAGLDKIL